MLSTKVICYNKTNEKEVEFLEDKSINVSYVYINQKPYESIENNSWIFQYGTNNKTLQGIFSRTINYIIQKHCPQYKLIPQLVSNYKDLSIYLKKSSISELHNSGLEGDHFIFAPMPMNRHLYYKLHYAPHLFSWQNGFAKSNGLVVVQRLSDVDITRRILRAVVKSKNLLYFLGSSALITAAIMWVVDRKWKSGKNGKFGWSIFNKLYWALVTITTVGYGDIVPKYPIGKFIGVVWMLIGLVIVSCLTSLITNDMMDNTVNIRNQRVGVVSSSWDDFVGRMLVNHERSSKWVEGYDSYEALLDAVKKDGTLFAGLMDENVASVMIDDIKERGLGK